MENNNKMRCLSCNCELSDKEANRKYKNYQEIKNPEARYIGLCNNCLYNAELEVDELENVAHLIIEDL